MHAGCNKMDEMAANKTSPPTSVQLRQEMASVSRRGSATAMPAHGSAPKLSISTKEKGIHRSRYLRRFPLNFAVQAPRGRTAHSKRPPAPLPSNFCASIPRAHQPNRLRELATLSPSNPRNPDFSGPARARVSDTLKAAGSSDIVQPSSFTPAGCRANCLAQFAVGARHPQ